MLISAKFIADAGITTTDTEDEFVDKVKLLASAGYHSSFSNIEACRAVFIAWKSPSVEVEHSEIKSLPRSSLYTVISVGGSDCETVFINSAVKTPTIPSAAEKVIAIYSAAFGVPDPLSQTNAACIYLWQNSTDKEKTRNLARSISGALQTTTEYTSILSSSTEVRTEETGETIRRPDILKLLKNAILEDSIKWKYLSYYRLFESGYLHEILHELKNNFFSSAKESLEDAMEKTKNELNQFINIADKPGIREPFEEIARLIKTEKINKFFISLERQSKKDGRYKIYNGNEFKQGVYFCYCIRCAIVHAGDSHLVFDKFDDAESAVLKIIPIFEKATFKYIGISYA
jgi:hypothetical protein